MTMYSQTKLLELIGPDKVPTGSGIPAVWWITTSPDQIAGYDNWRTDYTAHRDKVLAVAETLGCTEDPRIFSYGKQTILSGFTPPHRMTLWSGHPDHIPTPTGWRIDSKSGYLVPSRRTKADREGPANQQFAAVKRIPNVRAYLSGLPTEISLSDRNFGGTLYSVNYIRGEHCLIAYCGGDPERADHKLDIDTKTWERQRLSTLIALREQKEEANQ